MQEPEFMISNIVQYTSSYTLLIGGTRVSLCILFRCRVTYLVTNVTNNHFFTAMFLTHPLLCWVALPWCFWPFRNALDQLHSQQSIICMAVSCFAVVNLFTKTGQMLGLRPSVRDGVTLQRKLCKKDDNHKRDVGDYWINIQWFKTHMPQT